MPHFSNAFSRSLMAREFARTVALNNNNPLFLFALSAFLARSIHATSNRYGLFRRKPYLSVLTIYEYDGNANPIASLIFINSNGLLEFRVTDCIMLILLVSKTSHM